MVTSVNIQPINIDDQRYPSWDDWWVENHTLQIRIASHLSYDVYVKILFHALTEALLCLHRGISEQSVTDFDLDFEKKRAAGLYDESQEPGEHVLAPYRHEHAFAMVIEHLVYAEWIRETRGPH